MKQIVMAEWTELIEIQMKELREAERLEAQIREMVAAKRERLMQLWTKAMERPKVEATPVVAKIEAAAEAAPVTLPATMPVAMPAIVPERPFGSPGAPRDLLAESGAPLARSVGAGGVSEILKKQAASRKGEVPKAPEEKVPSAQQVFQSLNRLVGGIKDSATKH
jgi:hypothetical protein